MKPPARLFVKSILLFDNPEDGELLNHKLKLRCPFIQVIKVFQDLTAAMQFLKKEATDLIIAELNFPVFQSHSLYNFLRERQLNMIVLAPEKIPLLHPVQSGDLSLFSHFDPIRAIEAFFFMESGLALSESSTLFPFARQEAKIQLSNQELIRFVSPEDIIMCKADNVYTTFFLNSGEQIMVSKSLKKIELEMSDYPFFFRTHQSYLVNLRHITEIRKREPDCLILTNKLKALVSGSKISELRTRL